MRVNLIAEEEITKILEVLSEIRKEMGVKRNDPELDKMLERIDTNYIERSIIEQLQRAKKPWVDQLVKEFPDILKYPVQKPIQVVQSIATHHKEELNQIQQPPAKITPP